MNSHQKRLLREYTWEKLHTLDIHSGMSIDAVVYILNKETNLFDEDAFFLARYVNAYRGPPIFSLPFSCSGISRLVKRMFDRFGKEALVAGFVLTLLGFFLLTLFSFFIGFLYQMFLMVLAFSGMILFVGSFIICDELFNEKKDSD